MLYRCPRCGHDPLDGHKGKAKCSSCGTRFEQGRGAVIDVRPPNGPPERSSASVLMAAVEAMGGPGSAPAPRRDRSEVSPFREAKIAFGRAEGLDVIRWRGEVLGFSEKISWEGKGLIRLEDEVLTFRPSGDPSGSPSGRRHGDFSCLLEDIRGLQISSKALQVTLEGQRLYQFEFVHDSPKRWEDLLCLALKRLYARSGQSITEFTPRILATTHR